MFDHFDTQRQPEETKEFQDYIDNQEYLSTIENLDDEAKKDISQTGQLSARELRQDSIPAEADLMTDKVGRAGDESRIDALADFYQEQLENKTEKSAFLA